MISLRRLKLWKKSGCYKRFTPGEEGSRELRFYVGTLYSLYKEFNFLNISEYVVLVSNNVRTC